MAKPTPSTIRHAMYAEAKEWGLAIPKTFKVKATGPLTVVDRDLLLRVQKNLHARTPPLIPEKAVDGTFNSYVQKILVPPLSMADEAVHAAMKELGQHENPWGSNYGVRVRYYQTSTGAYRTFWCASFFWKMWQEAGYAGPTSAGAWASTDRIGKRLTLAQAIPGCGVSFDIGKGHIGMLLDSSRTMVRTIDGNTSDEVGIRERKRALIHSICLPHG